MRFTSTKPAPSATKTDTDNNNSMCVGEVTRSSEKEQAAGYTPMSLTGRNQNDEPSAASPIDSGRLRTTSGDPDDSTTPSPARSGDGGAGTDGGRAGSVSEC